MTFFNPQQTLILEQAIIRSKTFIFLNVFLVIQYVVDEELPIHHILLQEKKKFPKKINEHTGKLFK